MFPLTLPGDILVRPLQESDTGEVFRTVAANREHLRTWLPWAALTRSPEDTRTFIRSSLRELAEERSIALGVWVKGAYAGGTGYHRHDWQNMKSEIGYWIAERLQGQGIMTAVVRAILPYGFTELGMNRLEIHCATENLKSRAIPERLGFKLDGVMRQSHRLYSGYADLAIYAMLRSEFESMGGRGGGLTPLLWSRIGIDG